MKKHRNITLGLLALLATLFITSASAQLTLSGTGYTNNFNDIESGLPTGWDIYTNASATTVGNLQAWSLANSSPLSNTWAATSGRFANHASTISDVGTNFLGSEDAATQQAATNRSLAVRQTANFDISGKGGTAFVLKIADTVGRGNFSLNLDMLNLNVQPRITTWQVEYGLGSPPSSFSAVGWFTNDLAAFGATNMTFSFGSALDNQSQNVWIRIFSLPSTGSGNRRTFGLDNFALTWSSSTITNPVSIDSQPQSRTNNFGTTATFTVGASGTGPLYYQWRKGITDLVDDGSHIAGSTLPTLQLIGVSKADEGSYSCVVTNAKPSSQTSQAATLTVIDPAIWTQPAATCTNMPGDVGDFFARGAGTAPLAVQWLFNSSLIPGATNFTDYVTNVSSTLNVTNVQTTNQGNYAMVVSNQYGMTTSAPCALTVLATPTTRLARWDFNTTNTLVATAPAPSFGTGSASTVGLGIGGTNCYFPSGSYSDPAGPPGVDNSGWNTQYYPTNSAQSNKMVGVQFNVSTVGYKDILVAWEERHSNTASKYQRFQYSTNGTDFIDGPVDTYSDTGLNFVLNYVDLSGISGVNNNAIFAWRIVTEFESTATGGGTAGYVGLTSYVGGNSGGTIRYDLMTIYGNVTSAAPASIPLNIEKVGADVILTWTNAVFSLASSTNVVGPITNKVPSATSPYTNMLPGNVRFFRLIWP